MLAWVFTISNETYCMVIKLAVVIFYFIVNFIQTKQDNYNIKENIIENKICVIMNLQMIIILLLILMNNKFNLDKIDSTIWMMITLFYAILLILSAILRILI